MLAAKRIDNHTCRFAPKKHTCGYHYNSTTRPDSVMPEIIENKHFCYLGFP
jgi:hypothetical protein